MSEMELFQRLGLALAIGLLIGLERGWRERDSAEGSRVAGIRIDPSWKNLQRCHEAVSARPSAKA